MGFLSKTQYDCYVPLPSKPNSEALLLPWNLRTTWKYLWDAWQRFLFSSLLTTTINEFSNFDFWSMVILVVWGLGLLLVFKRIFCIFSTNSQKLTYRDTCGTAKHGKYLYPFNDLTVCLIALPISYNC